VSDLDRELIASFVALETTDSQIRVISYELSSSIAE